MAITYVVKQGECLSSIAKQFGFRVWRTIYNDPSNARLRSKRPDPNILFPGDEVMIPDRQAKDEAADTGRRHVFYTKATTTSLRLRVKRSTAFDYELAIDGEVVGSGTSDGDAQIVHEIAADAKRGELRVWSVDQRAPKTPDNAHRSELRLGWLDPIDTTSGVKGRLTNLGFYAGVVDQEIDAPTIEAIQAFRRSIGKVARGELDDELRADLARAHDACPSPLPSSSTVSWISI